MDWYEYERENGVKLIYKKFPEFHSVAVGVFIKTGSRFEKSQFAGISHFIEHLLFKGTKNRSCNEIKEAIEGVGGSFNGFTSTEATCYWIKILDKYIDLSFDVLSDMIKNPLLKEEDIEKERNVIIEEINMYRDIPARYVHEIFDSLIFQDHPLGMPISGTPETLKNIKRDDLINYINSNYSGENIVVSVAGKFEIKKLKKIFDKFFEDIEKKKENDFKKWEKKIDGPKVKIMIKETEQTHISFGGFAYSSEDERKYPLSILNIILGGNMSSRLFNRIRETLGLAYEIRSFVRQYKDTGIFNISAGISPENLEKTMIEIMKELKEIKEKGVKQDELDRAKRFLISQILMGLEDNLEYMLWIGEQKLLKKEMETLKEIVKKIEKVKKNQVEQIARDLYRRENLYLAVISKNGDESRLKEIISEI
ncbi:MAG: insulinase family protein [Candidatus Omnitrophica bacterium]|nr:insulinase family protein [Candidatus Omnitrophota bacterium]MCM8809084.1 insulinase family protein [Candidatus Omnitrophota bacterium]